MSKIILISIVIVVVVVVVVVTTSKSASAPTSAPTLSKTSAPTLARTLAPTLAPTIDPTLLNSKANLSGALFSGDVTVPNLYITGTLYNTGGIRAGDNRLVKPSDQSPGTVGFSFGIYSNGGSGGGGYSDCLNFNTYVDGSGGNSNLLMLNKNGIGMRVFQGGFQSSDVYSTYADSLMIDNQNVLLNTIPSSTVPAKKILTLDDSNKLKTAQGFGLISIFELNGAYKSSGSWKTNSDSLKRNAFRVSVPNQPVLFSGHVSGRAVSKLIEIRIRFNINGSQSYIDQSIKFWVNTNSTGAHMAIPINFVKNFPDPGSYDVNISEVNNELESDTNDVCYLNATILF